MSTTSNALLAQESNMLSNAEIRVGIARLTRQAKSIMIDWADYDGQGPRTVRYPVPERIRSEVVTAFRHPDDPINDYQTSNLDWALFQVGAR